MKDDPIYFVNEFARLEAMNFLGDGFMARVEKDIARQFHVPLLHSASVTFQTATEIDQRRMIADKGVNHMLDALRFGIERIQSLRVPRIVVSVWLTERVVDWGKVRSPSRASRRHRAGKRRTLPMKDAPRQDVLHHLPSNTIYVHPETLAEAMRKIAAHNDAERQRIITEAILYGSSMGRFYP